MVHEEGICTVMNTHCPTNAIFISDETLMLDSTGKYVYDQTQDVLMKRIFQMHFM